MEMTCCKSYLVTGSERTAEQTQRQYSCVSCFELLTITQDFRTSQIKNSMSFKHLLFERLSALTFALSFTLHVSVYRRPVALFFFKERWS